MIIWLLFITVYSFTINEEIEVSIKSKGYSLIFCKLDKWSVCLKNFLKISANRTSSLRRRVTIIISNSKGITLTVPSCFKFAKRKVFIYNVMTWVKIGDSAYFNCQDIVNVC